VKKTSQHIFVLTKGEQRVVILILLALLAGAVAMRYRETRSHIATPAPTTTQSSASPGHSPIEDE
jgi:hypothetical protein